MLTSDKHSNLLNQFLSYEENEVLCICNLVYLVSWSPGLLISQSPIHLAAESIKLMLMFISEMSLLDSRAMVS